MFGMDGNPISFLVRLATIVCCALGEVKFNYKLRKLQMGYVKNPAKTAYDYVHTRRSTYGIELSIQTNPH